MTVVYTDCTLLTMLHLTSWKERRWKCLRDKIICRLKVLVQTDVVCSRVLGCASDSDVTVYCRYCSTHPVNIRTITTWRMRWPSPQSCAVRWMKACVRKRTQTSWNGCRVTYSVMDWLRYLPVHVHCVCVVLLLSAVDVVHGSTLQQLSTVFSLHWLIFFVCTATAQWYCRLGDRKTILFVNNLPCYCKTLNVGMPFI